VTTDEVVNAYDRRIYIDPNDSRARALARSGGDFNPLASTLWRTVLALRPHWDCVLDIRANYGEMLAGADLSHADRVIAFEPNPTVAEHLRRTIAGLPWGVELQQLAVGAASGSARFVVDPRWSGKSHVAEHEDDDAIVVEMTSVDDVLRDSSARVVAVKIDVEGLETEVLAGMLTLQTRAELVVVMLEILHMSVQQVSVLTRTTPVYLLTAEGDSLVRVPTDDPMTTGVVLHDGSTHRENAVLVFGTSAEAFIAETPALRRNAVPAATAEAVALRGRLRVRERELRALRTFAERRSVRLVAGLTDRLTRLRRRTN
jgi:FkbM family methyltransferase